MQVAINNLKKVVQNTVLLRKMCHFIPECVKHLKKNILKKRFLSMKINLKCIELLN